MHPRHRQPTRAELHLLLKENDGLRTEIVRLRSELTSKQQYASRLELLLRKRMERIDELNAEVDQLRHQNKKLDAEAEHLAELVAANNGPSLSLLRCGSRPDYATLKGSTAGRAGCSPMCGYECELEWQSKHSSSSCSIASPHLERRKQR